MKRSVNLSLVFALIFSLFVPVFEKEENVYAATTNSVVLNEIAWMGTTYNYTDEWLELHNNTNEPIDLTGWSLNAQDGSPSINLEGQIPANGFYLLEKTDDNSVAGIAGDLIYSGSLGNSAEILELRDANGVLVDSVDAWYGGDNTSKATMERVDTTGLGTVAESWGTATELYDGGYGTPSNSSTSGSGGSTGGSTGDNFCGDTTEQLNNVSSELFAINVYFNKCALTDYATTGNSANYNVNLEDRLIERLNQATTSIDFATYEINLPRVVDTLINKAAQGVDVRVLADAKDATDPHYAERFTTMRLYIEEMVRGKDNVVGTNDDIHVFSDSAMLAVEDTTLREKHGLPPVPNDFAYGTYTIGSTNQTGYLFVDAEQKTDGTYYSPGVQMHNKFAVVDDTWVFTGSWNFTVTGLYGSEENMANGVLGGNQQHVVELHAPEIANAYETEFNEMWGSGSLTPDPMVSNFGTGKTDNTQHLFNVGGKTVEVYFSTGDDALGRMRELVKNEADINTYFTIFAWSDQGLVDELKNKYEGSYNDLEGTLTGFDVKGLFDSSFWNQWWSASVDMTGRTASQTSVDNPNTRWANPAPVYQGNEDRKLHSKTMLIDADTTSDPTVVVGSTNWSNNGNDVNDENMLIIHDKEIVNQFVQEFNARYLNAGGSIN
ncbi:competence protein ComEA [Sutcliffiella horikoshii]|uniref:phospholipase D n=1 Tax=Sutcliffiella horikoshii TaxID=79883 RepID=A0A5D4SWM6_9BACI|nr:phospholipase D-like domain-containing protein [Sutcliffiella horikoshii]TYS67837.1 competence protein ComEA [Sutcliffiella horikoshii]